MDFATWMDATFGPGITRLFMRPYNAKVWTVPADEMASAWIGERVVHGLWPRLRERPARPR